MEKNPLYPLILKDRATAFCIENVFGWDTMTEEEQQDQIQKVMSLLLENSSVKKILFEGMMN